MYTCLETGRNPESRRTFTRLAAGPELFVWRARVAERPGEHASAAPGTILELEQRLLVAAGAAGEGALELLEVQSAGKRRLAAPEFLRGARLARGQRFESR